MLFDDAILVSAAYIGTVMLWLGDDKHVKVLWKLDMIGGLWSVDLTMLRTQKIQIPSSQPHTLTFMHNILKLIEMVSHEPETYIPLCTPDHRWCTLLQGY